MPDSARSRILFVDDEAEITAILTDLFEGQYDCATAGSAEEAIDRIRQCDFELVVSDITMPGTMDGDQLAEWISERYPAIRILLTSGITQRGRQPFIAKPYSFIELERRIEKMLAG